MERALQLPACWAALLLLLGCQETQREAQSSATRDESALASAWLVDEATERGVDFTLDSGASGLWAIPEIMSGGVGLFDLEGDGDLDLYFVQSGDLTSLGHRSTNRLYENIGSGRFENITAASGAGDRGWGLGVAAGDFDGDGMVDLYVTNLGRNVLLRNRGDGTFEDVTDRAGVGSPGFSTSAAFVDYDLDGDLDLIALNYLEWTLASEVTCFDDRGQRDYCMPVAYEAPASNRLYRNEGDGRFADVSREAGLAGALGASMGVLVGRLTDDEWPDIFIANDGMADRLWVGSSTGIFEDEAVLRGCAADSSGVFKAGMGVDAGDIDNDGDLDLIVGNLKGETDSLFISESNGFLRDATAQYGLASSSARVTRFGLGLVDFDNDGWLDLFEAAGAVAQPDPRAGYSEMNRLLRQVPGEKFEEVAGAIFESAEPRTSRGVAFGDLDGDGAVDAVVVNRDAAANVLINRNSVPEGALQVRLLNRSGSPSLGASIEAEIGDRIVRRDVRTASSYLAASSPLVHIQFPPGLRPKRVRVRWPGGRTSSFSTENAQGVLVIQQRLD